jgi:hypothetical protein
MPRYYFNATEDAGSFQEHEGVEYDTIEKARDAAIQTLTEMARSIAPGETRRDFVITVQDESGSRIRATLSLRVESL